MTHSGGTRGHPATWLPQEISTYHRLNPPLVLSSYILFTTGVYVTLCIDLALRIQRVMRMNENTIICGDKVILVPYRLVIR